MKKWYKYILNYENSQKFLSRDETYDDHRKSMHGYKSDRGYGNKDEFFKVYFYNIYNNLANSRFRHYHSYLKNRLEKGKEILSIGSGRCVNELLLIENGYNIICSDLEQTCMKETMRIFPRLRFVKYDVRKSPFGQKFDSIISLSIFYLFDEQELLRVFKNIAGSLKLCGKFIFDPGGAENSFLTYLIDEIVCKIESRPRWIVKSIIEKRRSVIAKKHQGYRSKDKEIILLAEKAGFRLDNLKSSNYTVEIGRSVLLSRLLPHTVIKRIGKLVPHVRMFSFVKN